MHGSFARSARAEDRLIQPLLRADCANTTPPTPSATNERNMTGKPILSEIPGRDQFHGMEMLAIIFAPDLRSTSPRWKPNTSTGLTCEQPGCMIQTVQEQGEGDARRFDVPPNQRSVRS